jgi:hypothetical protein
VLYVVVTAVSRHRWSCRSTVRDAGRTSVTARKRQFAVGRSTGGSGLRWCARGRPDTCRPPGCSRRQAGGLLQATSPNMCHDGWASGAIETWISAYLRAAIEWLSLLMSLACRLPGAPTSWARRRGTTERDGRGLVVAASTSSVPPKCLRHLWASIYGISWSIVGRFVG